MRSVHAPDSASITAAVGFMTVTFSARPSRGKEYFQTQALLPHAEACLILVRLHFRVQFAEQQDMIRIASRSAKVQSRATTLIAL